MNIYPVSSSVDDSPVDNSKVNSLLPKTLAWDIFPKNQKLISVDMLPAKEKSMLNSLPFAFKHVFRHYIQALQEKVDNQANSSFDKDAIVADMVGKIHELKNAALNNVKLLKDGTVLPGYEISANILDGAAQTRLKKLFQHGRLGQAYEQAFAKFVQHAQSQVNTDYSKSSDYVQAKAKPLKIDAIKRLLLGAIEKLEREQKAGKVNPNPFYSL